MSTETKELSAALRDYSNAIDALHDLHSYISNVPDMGSFANFTVYVHWIEGSGTPGYDELEEFVREHIMCRLSALAGMAEKQLEERVAAARANVWRLMDVEERKWP
jgi:hypothetical protein